MERQPPRSTPFPYPTLFRCSRWGTRLQDAPQKSDPPRQGQPKHRRRKEARPGEIVDAALAVFAEKGFAATRLEEVAARAGISKGTIYLYFDSKEALFERSEEHTSELQSRQYLVCRLLLEKKKNKDSDNT